MFAKIRKKSTFLSLKCVFRPLNLMFDQKRPLFRNPHHLVDLKIEFPKLIFWDSFFAGITMHWAFLAKKVGKGPKNGSKVGKTGFFCTYANYRRNWARRLNFGLVLEDDWNLAVFEDEVERTKSQGFINDLVRESGNSAFSIPEKKFSWVLALYPIPLYHVLSDDACSQFIRYFRKTGYNWF